LLTPFAWEIGSGPCPTADWLPTHLYGEPIKDILARARESKPAAGPASSAANGVAAAAAPSQAADTQVPAKKEEFVF
jgi:hypothetical protein